MVLCRFFCFLLAFGFTEGSRWRRFEDNLATDCLRTLGHETIDLCPLANAPQRIFEYPSSAGSDIDKVTFVLRVGRGPGQTDLQDCSRKGSSDTWICMIASVDGSRDLPRPVPITVSFAGEEAQVPGKGSHEISIPHPFHVEEAHITFICDNQTHDSSPTFVGQGLDVLLFSWQTPHACGTTPSLKYGVTEGDMNSGGEEQDDKPKDEQELIQRPISGSRLRFTTIIILLSLSGISILGYIFYSPPRIIRQFVSAHVKPIRFRVGETRLIQWAQEDLGFSEDEVDVMVNGGMDERIPLKPSPRPNSWFANYGSAG